MHSTYAWKSGSDIEALLEKLGDQGLGQLFALSLFWKALVLPAAYEPDSSWGELINLTEAGDEARAGIRGVTHDASDHRLNFAIFRLFAYHEILIDWHKSDPTGIELLFARELLAKEVLLPYRFGRLLYDRFNDRYKGSQTEHLSSEEVLKLLADTPPGVYQINSFLTGPLGLVHSNEKRFLPPSLFLPLWHCSDTGCRRLHRVELLPPELPVIRLEHELRNYLKDSFGPPSEWEPTLTRCYLQLREREAKGMKFYDLPVLIADGILGAERTRLLEAVLTTDEGEELRNVLGAPPRKKARGQGEPYAVAESLTAEEQLQLLLVLSDALLIRTIDELTLDAKINVSVGQIRLAHQKPPSLPLSSRSQLSRLGLRSIKENPVTSFIQIVHKAYLENDAIGELVWRLRVPSGTSPIDGLMNYLQRKGPSEAVNDLILTSQSVTHSICQFLDLPAERVARQTPSPVKQILWKFGFDPPQYDEFSNRLGAHLERFEESVLALPDKPTEDDRERIRSSGVNLFVYVEQMLDMLISYNVWLLATDHFLDSRQDYDLVQARRSVPRVLGESLPSKDSEVSWSFEGENSLGVLLLYLSESLAWMKSLEKRDREILRRPEADVPHFAEGLQARFPFNHVELWADADVTELRSYIHQYEKIVTLLLQAELAYVRNGLDHMRDAGRFPTSDRMLACISRLRQAHHICQVNRYLPVILWLDRVEGNRFGVVERQFRDATDKLVVVHGPPMALCLNEPGSTRPYLIAPGNLLGGPNASLIFGFRERTEYDDYWRDYPRRRHINPVVIEAAASGASTEAVESILENQHTPSCEQEDAGDA